MLRTLLIAGALLGASGTALAHADQAYGRVIVVEPQFTISFGRHHHDGFRVLYESGGYRYWTHTPYHPGPTLLLPPHHRVKHIHQHHDYGQWDGHRDWDRHRDGWRDDYQDHRRHGRDDHDDHDDRD